MRTLVFLEGNSTPQEVVPDGEVTIGRAPDGTVVLRDRTVSRRHAVIRPRGEDLVVEDFGSVCGTFLNGEPLPAGKTAVLNAGDVLRIGQVRIVYRFDSPETDSSDLTRNAAFAAQANARVLVLEGELVRRRALARPAILIGGARHCQIQLSDRNAPPEQAAILARDGVFLLESRSSTRPPLLNEEQIPVAERMPLPSNSVFCVEDVQILFLYDFGPDGHALADPLARVSRRKILRFVSEQTGLCYRSLRRLCRDRSRLGQSVGEILVERGLLTPLFWRVLCQRLLG